jgi:hypothetical protein
MLFLQEAVEVHSSKVLHFLDNRLTDDDEVVSLKRAGNALPQKITVVISVWDESTPGP